MGYISAFSSYLVFFIAFEYVLKKSKFILTFATSLLVLIIAILPFSISKSVTYISSLVFTVVLIVVMLFLTKKSHPDFQIVPLAILIGTLIIFIGHMLDASMIRILELVPTVIPPILYIIGCIIFISPTFYDPIKGSKEYLYWILFYTFYLFIIGISIYSTIVEASLNNALLNLSYTIFWIIIIFVGFVSVFLLNRKFNYQVRLREGKVQMIKEKDPLSLFTKKEKNELNKIAELQHIYVILKSGITIYSQPLLGELDESQEEKDMFLGSAITAIETFLKEMSESKTNLKEVKQENISILIEEGKYVRIAIIASHDQKRLRYKMQVFLLNFEHEFEVPLKENISDTRLFNTVGELVNAVFK